MGSLLKAVEMRSVIALVSVLGAITLAITEPEYGQAAVGILGTAVGGYFGQLQGHGKDSNK